MSHKPLTDKQLQEAGRMYTMGGGTYGAAERVIAHVAELAFQNGLAQSAVRTLALWLPIETAPKSGNALLLGYENSRGKWLTFRGKWISKDEIEREWDQPEDFDAGWYEESVEADDIPNCWPVTPSHWMLLPSAPAAPTPAAQSAGHEAVLPPWWSDFIQNVCELPDRSSPEDEPDAMIATAEELESCAMAAIEGDADNSPATDSEEAEALRAFDQSKQQGHSHDLESYCAGYIDRGYAAPVNGGERDLAQAIHYPECWDTAAYPTLPSALAEVHASFKCTNDECGERAADAKQVGGDICAKCAGAGWSAGGKCVSDKFACVACGGTGRTTFASKQPGDEA